MYYEKLRNLVKSGNLRILLVIAPPRSSSTLMEKTLSFSPSVNLVSHEPFMCVGYSELDPDLGYKSIIDSVNSRGPIKGGSVVVIKDMAHWLTAREEHRNFFRLIYDPIMLMIRNPLLSTESRIRKVVQAISINPRVSTQRYILEVFACNHGYKGWAQMREQMSKKPNESSSIDVDLEMADLGKAYYHPDNMLQEKLLNYFAAKSGFADWDDFVRSSLKSRDYTLLEKALKFDDHRFAPELSGWKELDRLADYLKANNHPFLIVDSTEFRLDPEGIMKKITDKLNIIFADGMINWTKPLVKVSSEQERSQDLIWYDTLMKSTNIKPPVELLPRLADFPSAVKENLKKIDFPVYFKLFGKMERIQGQMGLDQKQYSVKVPENLKLKFSDAGIKVGQGEGEANVTIQDVDPVFSVLYNPSLLKNKAYLARKRYYEEEFSLVRRMFDGRGI